jgi:hypothetical protein
MRMKVLMEVQKEVREYVVERGRKSLWKSFEERHALRVFHVVC